jgi:SAM-dependent methyltransferase
MTNPAPNQQMAEYWNSDEGAHWVEHADHYERTLAPFVDLLLSAAKVTATDRVLDIGCGFGPTTRAAARAADQGEAVGVDISRQLSELATRRAHEAGITNVRFEVGDAQVYPLPAGAFDVAISRFGVMFFDDPTAAFTNIGRALRPGGRLALLIWQELAANEWLFVPGAAVASVTALPEMPAPGAPGPFALADADRVRAILRDAGFDGIALDAVREPMWLGDTVADTVSFFTQTGFGKGVLKDADAATADRIRAALAAALEPYASPQGVRLGGTAWLVTATRPG